MTAIILAGFLASVGIGFVGMRLILAARADALRARIEREQAVIRVAQMDLRQRVR